MTQAKIKLLIPVEIKDGCELPEKSDYYVCKFRLSDKKEILYFNKKKKTFYRYNEFALSSQPIEWYKETELTIDELKKLGVLKD